MIVTSKNQEWEKLEREFKRTVDRLGKHIDAGILDTVVALNANGINTTASCEGHLDWGAPYPWVDVDSSDPRIAEIDQQIAILLSEGKKPETEQLYLEIAHLNYQEELKLGSVLEAFYQHHPIVYDRHIIFIHDIRGGCRIQSLGADTQEFRTPDDQALKLAEYQAEMQAFTDFLKGCFFGENIKQEYLVSEAAGLLGMRHRTLNSHVERGNIKAMKRGRDLYITAEELDRFKNTPRKVGRPAKVQQ
jgi:hypothetical protein